MTDIPYTAQPVLPLYVDATMMTTYRSCPRKFLLEFVCGFRPSGLSIDLHAGACFANTLELVGQLVWRDGKSLTDALVLAHAAFWQNWGDFQIPDYKKTAKRPDRVWAAVEAYFKQWPPHTDHITPYIAADGKPTFEYTFAVPLEPTADTEEDGCFPKHPSGQPFLYSGRFDMLGQMNGRPIIRDEKTSKGIGDKWSEQWDLRSQFIGYTWACQQCGIPVEEVAVRGIAILVGDIKLTEAIKPYNAHLVRKWHEQLRRDLWRLRRAWDSGYFDYNFADACTAYGNCAFMTPCGSTTPESWLNNYEVRRWDPLKKNPTGDAAAASAAA